MEKLQRNVNTSIKNEDRDRTDLASSKLARTLRSLLSFYTVVLMFRGSFTTRARVFGEFVDVSHHFGYIRRRPLSGIMGDVVFLAGLSVCVGFAPFHHVGLLSTSSDRSGALVASFE